MSVRCEGVHLHDLPSKSHASAGVETTNYRIIVISGFDKGFALLNHR
jgi:hypothetical protein